VADCGDELVLFACPGLSLEAVLLGETLAFLLGLGACTAEFLLL